MRQIRNVVPHAYQSGVLIANHGLGPKPKPAQRALAQDRPRVSRRVRRFPRLPIGNGKRTVARLLPSAAISRQMHLPDPACQAATNYGANSTRKLDRTLGLAFPDHVDGIAAMAEFRSVATISRDVTG